MVRLLDIKRTYSDGGMRLLLLADSKGHAPDTALGHRRIKRRWGGYSGQYSNHSCT